MHHPKRFIPPTTALRALESFQRTGNVTETGDELGVTQSAVSRQLKVIEDYLDVPLFVRDRKRITLTSAAEAYCEEVRGALDKIATASLRLKANPSGGNINIAILPAFGVRWLASRLPEFVAEHPEVTVNLSTQIKPFDIAQTGHHGAIHFGKMDWPDVNYLHLMKEFVVPVATPDLKDQMDKENIASIYSLPLLHLESRPDAWEVWTRYNDQNLSPPTGMLFDQFASLIQAAIHGMGAALVPTYLVEKELKKGKLVPLVDVPLVSIGDYYFVWPNAVQDYPALTIFRKWLEQEAKSSPA